ncbi:hypothetical protein HHL16_18965 [Pseudoflavitalea sp. G-6-1-2]|uniref:hypothetical protein n=1 Tax=Pseudoflavitalea sp. G-6-1-2 TaxID=2728841 RepID=UPI00146F7E0E|nr:hypothetical protein [Pseudoflavitalea sp. G-6-1-2]NML22966.1 hypothetical protein [Pseudoflavitalea sp. G-6-1-2]
MKLFIFSITLFIVCCKESPKHTSIELITEQTKQEQIFKGLMAVTNNIIPENVRKDSLAILLLPLEVSCPSCRKKTIDSIISHGINLPYRHYIILSATEGYDSMNKFFKDRKGNIPPITNRLFLDSINHARVLRLVNNKPTIYYTSGEKAFKRVSSIPETIKSDLKEFFSGS